MKRRYSLLLAIAAAIFLASCSDENNTKTAADDNSQKESIVAPTQQESYISDISQVQITNSDEISDTSVNQQSKVSSQTEPEIIENESVEKIDVPYGTNPILPWDYQKILGKGIDVDWCKTKEGKENYSAEAVKNFKQNGVNHVRIRVKDSADEDLFSYLDKQINDCLEYGIIPIVAYQADELKNNPDSKNLEKVVKWWGKVAERYKDISYLLSFDMIIEVSDSLNKESDFLNEIYENIVKEIRKTNEKRILMMSPRVRSDAQYLSELKIPSQHNGYLMAEWHFYAAGPSKTNDRKLWTVGTDGEKAKIQEKIALALDFQENTGIPTWVGAWMPGNYNDENNYSIDEQVVFAKYMSNALNDAKIPFAVNSDTKFYDRNLNKWIEEMQPVYNAIFN